MASLIGYAEAADILGLKHGTLYAMVSQRRIPHVRMGGRLVRFDSAELERWVESRRVAVSPEVDSGAHVSDRHLGAAGGNKNGRRRP
ncbi:MAG: helix-turn-helix domain-containing protein [Pseudomonadota bacterium]